MLLWLGPVSKQHIIPHTSSYHLTVQPCLSRATLNRILEDVLYNKVYKKHAYV